MSPTAASTESTPALSPPLPEIIQGGMGVAISGWRLAAAVARTGQLGVVSGTALEVVMVRRLQDGDDGGHVRRALARFPIPAIADRIVSAYLVEGGKPPGTPYRNVPMYSARPARLLQELTVAANFVEVSLAREGHDGPVGINYLRKIEAPIPFGLYGAMLAGVDAVLVGAGNPHELPALLTRLAGGLDVGLPLRIQGPATQDVIVRFDPSTLFDDGPPPHLRRPAFYAIVASNDLAAGLAAAADPPDGFVVEGPLAGGHNAPPRGPRRVDDRDQPVYDDRDEVDLAELAALGLPFWLAGSHGTPDGLRAARAAGAAGVQVGTAFALSRESGLAPPLKRAVLDAIAGGTLDVLTDWRASPTGFPFKVARLDGTLSAPDVVAARQRVCDIGALRVPYQRDDGTLGYRCPAEPVHAYTEVKGARAANTEGRICLCNALLATADQPQTRPDGTAEPALVTLGDDTRTVRAMLARQADPAPYPARDVIDYLRVGA
jgi:NAD(P)H-dependent flavin oxidoreductase YrpB (nitropropane dioxygenase family)